MKTSLFLSILLLSFGMVTPAQAQRFELQGLYQRIGRLENDMGMVQRQAALGGGGAPAASAATNTGQISAEIMRIDEEMRGLRGEIERLNYQNDQNAQKIVKMQEDIDYRLQELEKRSTASAMPAMAPEMPTASVEAPAMAKREDLTEELTAVVRNQEAGALAQPSAASPMNPRDLYNSAFKQLNQTNYAGAEKSFLEFTQKYPNDPLAGNAWYWLGEAYYVQREYMKASDSFRQGYTKLPDGPKAGDNLLKLAMSLAALKHEKEACVVLKQVDKKFSANSAAIKTKTQQEISRLACR